ncbi:16807_t:CDS:2, partial [Gigaspora margarita]
SNIKRTRSKAFYTIPILSALLPTMLATQSSSENTTNYQTIQTTKSMELDSLPQHTAKKAKASTNLPGMKFLYDNPYIVIAPAADPHDDQDTTMQQPDQAQNTQNVTEQVKETTLDMTNTQAEKRHSLLEDKSIYIEFELTGIGPLKREDDIGSTTSHAKQNMMDTNTNSNATVEGIEIPYRLYSSVVKNKDQILQEMESVDSSS